MSMQYLDDQLKIYGESEAYPFHMPGHKRRELDFPNPYTIDITEIDGFDNLHHAEGILKEAQERAAALYGSDCCYYLVNGSTCGILAAICAATKKRDKVLVARNSHKAVYHAMALHELESCYLYPAITENDLQGQITPEQVKAALIENPDAAAVIVTSPTYEGIISDIKGIADAAHSHGVPLIVDAAHGAHLGFGAEFPENPVKLGADAVIMSLHKTLPSFTQTALLHLNGTMIEQERVARYLGMFETSSPSYLFMAGMDACVRMLKQQGTGLFLEYRRKLDDFYSRTADLKYLHVMRKEDLSQKEAYAWDDSKLVIFTGDSGERLHQILRERYQLQMEMVSGKYVLGMTSIMDTEEGFDRLVQALHEIDAELICQKADGRQNTEEVSEAGFTARMYQPNRRQMQIYQVMDFSSREVSFDEAVGKMSADYIFLYPPGIPMIVPGEIISRGLIENIRECIWLGLHIEGLANPSLERIKIVYF